MPVLHNRISNDELKAKMLAESEPRTTISFYKYFTIASPQQTRDALYQVFTALDVFGRVYLAHEGINAQISVPQSKLETFRQQLYTFDPALDGVRLNIALEDDGKSFWVLRMKVRDRIVADGIDDPTFDASNVGDYLKAADVNAMLDDPDAVFIDMRNHYEYEVGHFENALEIPADTFREQLPKAVEMLREHADKKIVMYCTGGIRCEKASAWMKHTGLVTPLSVRLPVISSSSPSFFTLVEVKVACGNFATLRNSALRRCLSRSAWLVSTLLVLMVTFTLSADGFFSSKVNVPSKSLKVPYSQL